MAEAMHDIKPANSFTAKLKRVQELFPGIRATTGFCTVLESMSTHAGPYMTFTDICAHTGLGRSLVSRVVSRLIRNGFVQGVDDKEDRRSKRLKLSPKGVKLAREIVT